MMLKYTGSRKSTKLSLFHLHFVLSWRTIKVMVSVIGHIVKDPMQDHRLGGKSTVP